MGSILESTLQKSPVVPVWWISSHPSFDISPLLLSVALSVGQKTNGRYWCTQAAMVQEEDGIECEIIDLRTLLPWDREAVGAHSDSSTSSVFISGHQEQSSNCAHARKITF